MDGRRGRVCPRGAASASYRHGHATEREGKSREYLSWRAMRARCENPKDPAYARYGGRGIKVCERWRSFENFLADMGERPPRKSLDREDNNGDYCADNCRWATRREQASNTRANNRITVDGVTRTITEWARNLGLDPSAIRYRVERMGWPAEKAVTTPRSTTRGAKSKEVDNA